MIKTGNRWGLWNNNNEKKKSSDFLIDLSLALPCRLIKHCTRQIYLFYIFIQRYTFYLLIFLWTDAKLIVNIE